MAGHCHDYRRGVYPAVTHTDLCAAVGAAGTSVFGTSACNHESHRHWAFVSIVLGILLAVVMDANEKVERALYPVIVASQTIPTTAIAPLFILWFGYSIWSKVLVTILITFFPIAITVFDGFKATKREMEELLQTYGATKADIFWKLKLPTALPNFSPPSKWPSPSASSGLPLRMAGAQEGLGYFSKRMMTQLDGAGVFAPVVLLSITAMLAVGIITVLEYRFIKWRKEI